MHNTLVDRYRQLSSQHLTTAEIEVLADSVLLRDPDAPGIATVAARSTLRRGQRVDAHIGSPGHQPRRGHDIQVTLPAGQSVTLARRDDLHEPGRRDIDSGNKRTALSR